MVVLVNGQNQQQPRFCVGDCPKATCTANCPQLKCGVNGKK